MSLRVRGHITCHFRIYPPSTQYPVYQSPYQTHNPTSSTSYYATTTPQVQRPDYNTGGNNYRTNGRTNSVPHHATGHAPPPLIPINSDIEPTPPALIPIRQSPTSSADQSRISDVLGSESKSGNMQERKSQSSNNSQLDCSNLQSESVNEKPSLPNIETAKYKLSGLQLKQ